MQRKASGNIQVKNFVGKFVNAYTQGYRYGGKLLAVDQYMNLVLHDCVEAGIQDETQKRLLGLILLRGEQVQFIVPTNLEALEPLPQKSNVVQPSSDSLVVKVPTKPHIPGLGGIPGLKGLPGLRK